MIPYNPCGAIVEWGRERYRTRFRPFRDSDIEAEIIWYPALPGAKPLPWGSAISQLVWDRELVGMDPQHEGVGEVVGAKHYISHMGPVPGADGSHVCGTREDFEFGAVYDPDRPPIPFRADGLPVCCPGGIGGLFWGGKAVVVPIPRGGLAWGGESVQQWDGTYFASPDVGPGALLFNEFGVSSGQWFIALGGLTLNGPPVTGVPGRWEILSAGETWPFGAWRVDDWTGWGVATFTLVGGGPSPATWSVRRGDSL